MKKSIKVPKYIQDKMHKVARLQLEIQDMTDEIEQWLVSKGVNIEVGVGEIRSGDGRGLDELDYGNDVTDEIVARLEDGDY